MTSGKSYIGERLRRLLQTRGLTIRAFSDATGIPYRTLQDYLGNKNRPGTAHLAAMARAGVDLNWLLGTEWSPITPDSMEEIGVASDSLKGNRALLIEIRRRVFRAVDVVNEDHVKEHGRSLSFDDLLLLHARSWSKAIRVAEEMSSIVQDLTSRGVPTDTVADVICGSLDKHAKGLVDEHHQQQTNS